MNAIGAQNGFQVDDNKNFKDGMGTEVRDRPVIICQRMLAPGLEPRGNCCSHTIFEIFVSAETEIYLVL